MCRRRIVVIVVVLGDNIRDDEILGRGEWHGQCGAACTLCKFRDVRSESTLQRRKWGGSEKWEGWRVHNVYSRASTRMSEDEEKSLDPCASDARFANKIGSNTPGRLLA